MELRSYVAIASAQSDRFPISIDNSKGHEIIKPSLVLLFTPLLLDNFHCSNQEIAIEFIKKTGYRRQQLALWYFLLMLKQINQAFPAFST